jgi:hypothetical protein
MKKLYQYLDNKRTRPYYIYIYKAYFNVDLNECTQIYSSRHFKPENINLIQSIVIFHQIQWQDAKKHCIYSQVDKASYSIDYS